MHLMKQQMHTTEAWGIVMQCVGIKQDFAFHSVETEPVCMVGLQFCKLLESRRC